MQTFLLERERVSGKRLALIGLSSTSRLGGTAIEAKYLKDTYGVLLFIIIFYR